mmetsp:Transcript_6103/g.12955  ORF Transcript_6103/g.12955 Transcript_6103/m.12955 type:complete len:80 (+) Transcript_6103:522-761(+)
MQAYNKCTKDFDELKHEKENRTSSLSMLHKNLKSEYDLLTNEIGSLKDNIFHSADYINFKNNVEAKEIEKETLKTELDY